MSSAGPDDRGLTLRDLMEEAEAAESAEMTEPEKSMWERAALALPEVWLTEMPPRRQWVLHRNDGDDLLGYLPAGIVGCLAGAGGVGKSMAALELALAVAVGSSALGLQAPQPGRRVLYLAAEDDGRELRRRLYRVAKTRGWTHEDLGERLVVLPLAGRADLALTEPNQSEGATEAATSLAAYVAQLAAEPAGLALVVVDPLSRFAGIGTESSNEAATRIVQVLESLAKRGPAVLVVHHTSQAARQDGTLDATAVRGVTALTDGFRWASLLRTVTAPEGSRWARLDLVKSNYTGVHPEIYLRQREHGLWEHLPAEEYERFQRELEEKQAAKKARKATQPKPPPLELP